jgi:hypothetical protein
MHRVEKIHKDVLDDYEFGNCFSLSGFTIVDYDGPPPDCPIYINETWHRNVWPLCRSIIQPTPYFQGRVQAHTHLLEGVTLGVNIRRGNYSPDSVQFAGSTDPKFYFCSDTGLSKFKDAIARASGRVYVTSDSSITKRHLKDVFGDKVTMLDTVYTHTAEQTDESVQTIKNLQDVYISWYLLSKCPAVLVTGGRTDMVGFSTFGYMAAVYGGRPLEIVFNEDFSAS